jgi:hypothetical protein
MAKTSMYMFYLIDQFNSSIDKNLIGEYSSSYRDDFKEWLITLRKNTIIYQQFLQEHLGTDLNCPNVVEIEKGEYDSVSLPLTSIISQYGSTLQKSNSELVLLDNNLVVFQNSSVLPIDNYSLFMTHNPYASYNLTEFRALKDRDKNVCIGAYGLLRDKDRDRKIRLLKSYLSDNLEEEYDTYRGTYLYCLHTKINTLKQKKIKKNYFIKSK